MLMVKTMMILFQRFFRHSNSNREMMNTIKNGRIVNAIIGINQLSTANMVEPSSRITTIVCARK